MTDISKWSDRYQTGDSPWDTGRPSPELQRVLQAHNIRPCRALELGCGTGTNSVWLAQQGFDVTGLDVAPLALERAEERARAAGVKVRFLQADVLAPPELDARFAFFFDRGCYHVVRRDQQTSGEITSGEGRVASDEKHDSPLASHPSSLPRRHSSYASAVVHLLEPGALGLVLAGNAREPRTDGPPLVTEEQIRDELGRVFHIVDLHEFRFDTRPGSIESFLAWSCLLASPP